MDGRGEGDGVGDTVAEAAADGEGDAEGEGEPLTFDAAPRAKRNMLRAASAFVSDILITMFGFWKAVRWHDVVGVPGVDKEMSPFDAPSDR